MYSKDKLSILILILILSGVAGLYSCTDAEGEALRYEMEEEDHIHADFSDTTIAPSPVDSLKTIAYLKKIERGLNRLNFEDSMKNLYQAIDLENYNLKYKVFRHAMIGYYSLRQDGLLNDKNLVSIIDFSQTSCDKRFYTIDLDKKEIIYNSLVSHGRNTGNNLATKFSNIPRSNQSSLGFYVTAETYYGSKGYSLKLDGIEKGVNDNMRKRAVVMHKANYVSEDWVSRYGRIGRSQGCPALPTEISEKVINTIKNKTAIFAYYDDDNYLKASNYLNLEKLLERFDKDSFDVPDINEADSTSQSSS
ncbi:MAG: murein L,D-transpeptidase catalytic domain family protein [Cyclobacteriaceae bacterium]